MISVGTDLLFEIPVSEMKIIKGLSGVWAFTD
jgi:hypothetical protein